MLWSMHNDGYTTYKGPSQVRIKPKSYKTHQVSVKFENNLIHHELSLVLPVLACTKRVEVCLAFLSATNRFSVSYLPLVAFCSGVIPVRGPRVPFSLVPISSG